MLTYNTCINLKWSIYCMMNLRHRVLLTYCLDLSFVLLPLFSNISFTNSSGGPTNNHIKHTGAYICPTYYVQHTSTQIHIEKASQDSQNSQSTSNTPPPPPLSLPPPPPPPPLSLRGWAQVLLVLIDVCGE